MKRLLKKRYEIIEVLGKGGMGAVYKVADRSPGGKVFAAKELRLDTLSAGKAREALVQFQTEARILLNLTHPNLPKVYDYFSRRGAYYFIMEFIQGRTLEHILDARRGRPVDERLALSWTLQLCRAIHFLSVQKPRPIVFRDLKPSNIMITSDGRVKLIDFGIARFFKEDKLEDTYLYGTPGYAAPEQYGIGQTDVRSDIFSLGATLHHCVTGRSPSENPLAVPDARYLNPSLSRETAAIIKKALEPRRDKRFQGAYEMKTAVQKVLLDQRAPKKGTRKIIYASQGKMIKLPWRGKTSWVSVPAMALGCSGATGILRTDDPWIKPKPTFFGPESTRLLFRVENSMLKPGREYRPRITVKTEAGILRPHLLLKKQLPWIIIQAAALAAMAALAALMRAGR